MVITCPSYHRMLYQYSRFFEAVKFLQPATKLGQGNIFTSVCQEFCQQGCLPPTPRPAAVADTPRSSACWEIGATSGRYASYWNAYLYDKLSVYISDCMSGKYHLIMITTGKIYISPVFSVFFFFIILFHTHLR